MAFQSNKIVVWERSNKLGNWCPYSSDVCRLLEEKFEKDIPSVCLGDIDETLKIYSVNFKDMLQISEVTGTKLAIRRRLCDNLSALGRGFSWQWHDDHDVWNTYDADINDFIDCAFLEGKESVSLNKKFPGYPYDIIFTKMIQINKRSKRKRKIRRLENSSPYPNEAPPEVTDSDKKMEISGEVQKLLSPEFLAQEIPGTANLLNQVDAYKRNVQSLDFNNLACSNKMEDSVNDVGAKHAKYSVAGKEDSQVSDLYVS